jgi:hypothetical protein
MYRSEKIWIKKSFKADNIEYYYIGPALMEQKSSTAIILFPNKIFMKNNASGLFFKSEIPATKYFHSNTVRRLIRSNIIEKLEE